MDAEIKMAFFFLVSLGADFNQFFFFFPSFFPFHSSISKEKEQLREKLELLPGQMGLTGSA